jgi:hypothetical protein
LREGKKGWNEWEEIDRKKRTREKEEGVPGRRREGTLPNSSDKLRSKRYGSCSLLPLVLETQN